MLKLRIEPCESWGKYVLEVWAKGRWMHLHTDHLVVVERMQRTLEAAGEPPRTITGDGKPLPKGVWVVRDVFLYAVVSDGVHPCVARNGWTYTFVGPVPEEEGK